MWREVAAPMQRASGLIVGHPPASPLRDALPRAEGISDHARAEAERRTVGHRKPDDLREAAAEALRRAVA
jgi:hypothetical protein